MLRITVGELVSLVISYLVLSATPVFNDNQQQHPQQHQRRDEVPKISVKMSTSIVEAANSRPQLQDQASAPPASQWTPVYTSDTMDTYRRQRSATGGHTQPAQYFDRHQTNQYRHSNNNYNYNHNQQHDAFESASRSHPAPLDTQDALERLRYNHWYGGDDGASGANNPRASIQQLAKLQPNVMGKIVEQPAYQKSVSASWNVSPVALEGRTVPVLAPIAEHKQYVERRDMSGAEQLRQQQQYGSNQSQKRCQKRSLSKVLASK